MVDKSIAEKHFKAIGEYLKQKNMYADDLESLKQYTSLLETELLTLKNTTVSEKWMCSSPYIKVIYEDSTFCNFKMHVGFFFDLATQYLFDKKVCYD